jgi:hypothetical protein
MPVMRSPLPRMLAVILLVGCKSSTSAPPDAQPAGLADAVAADGPVTTDGSVLADGSVMTDGPSTLPLVDAAATVLDGSAETGPQAAGCDHDLSGTWDLLAMRPGASAGGAVLVIGASGFSYTGSGGQLEYLVGTTRKAIWNTGGQQIPINVTNQPADFKTGDLPFGLGGSWSFATSSQKCAMDVSPGLVSAQCRSDDPGDPNVGGWTWPSSIPRLRTDRTYVMSRTVALASVFGDLGGNWNARATPSSSLCSATLEGNKITVNCSTDDNFNGLTQLTVGANCIASGTASGGYQIAGRRR